jgi:hypothetical protein
MWNDMFIAGISYGEKAARTIIVYLALLTMLRIVGKRGLAQLNTFDLVVMLLLSNVVQNAVIGNDNSVSGGLFGAAVLLLTDAVLVRQGARWPLFARLLEGSPTVLAEDGVLNLPAMRRQGISAGDVALAVHTQGGTASTRPSSWSWNRAARSWCAYARATSSPTRTTWPRSASCWSGSRPASRSPEHTRHPPDLVAK